MKICIFRHYPQIAVNANVGKGSENNSMDSGIDVVLAVAVLDMVTIAVILLWPTESTAVGRSSLAALGLFAQL